MISITCTYNFFQTPSEIVSPKCVFGCISRKEPDHKISCFTKCPKQLHFHFCPHFYQFLFLQVSRTFFNLFYFISFGDPSNLQELIISIEIEKVYSLISMGWIYYFDTWAIIWNGIVCWFMVFSPFLSVLSSCLMRS